MSRKPKAAATNIFSQLYNDIREYIERCFGVNDIERRYLREAELHQQRESRVRARSAASGRDRSKN